MNSLLTAEREVNFYSYLPRIESLKRSNRKSAESGKARKAVKDALEKAKGDFALTHTPVKVFGGYDEKRPMIEKM